MLSNLQIRSEQADDAGAIAAVTTSAFKDHPYSQGTEAAVINGLRNHDALAVSLVATLNDRLVGHIAFSPAAPAGGAAGWYALGPVSVLPELQRQGIGSLLINTGLEQLRSVGAAGCILVGDSEYYRRFGFVSAPGNCPPGEPAEFFMLTVLRGPVPLGAIHFHSAFHVNAT